MPLDASRGVAASSFIIYFFNPTNIMKKWLHLKMYKSMSSYATSVQYKQENIHLDTNDLLQYWYLGIKDRASKN